MHEWTFDLTLDVAISVKAATFEEAAKLIKDKLDCAWARFGETEFDPSPLEGEATLNEEITTDMLGMVDGCDTTVCPECGAIEGTEEWGTVGDGYDGYCPNCADEREASGIYGG